MSDTTLKSINDMTFIQKVNFIQCNLNAPKNMYNSFGKYNYRNLEGIFEGLKPLSLITGLVTTVSDEMVMIGDRIYVKATATITDGDNSLSVTRYAREDAVKKGMDLSQLTGSCSSYAGRMLVMVCFLLMIQLMQMVWIIVILARNQQVIIRQFSRQARVEHNQKHGR